MDFNFDTSPANEEQNNNQTQPEENKNLTNLDQMLTWNFNLSQMTIKIINNRTKTNNMDFMMNNIKFFFSKNR